MTAFPTEETSVSSISGYKRLSNLMLRVVEIGAVLGTLAIIAHVLGNVAGRFLFRLPVPGTFEMVEHWYMPIVCCLGFVIAKARKEHTDAPLIYDRVSPKNKLVLSIIANILATATCAVFAYYTVGESVDAFEVQLTSGVTGVPIWPAVWIMPIVFAALTFMFALDVLAEIRTKRPVGASVGAEH